MKKILTFLATAAIITGCQKDNAEQPNGPEKPEKGKYRISAELPDSRTSLSEGKTVWIDEDELSLAHIDGSNLEYYTDFMYYVDGNEFWGNEDPFEDESYIAYYPVDYLGAVSEIANGKIKFNLPSTQTQAADGDPKSIIEAYDCLYSDIKYVDAPFPKFMMNHAFSLVKFTVTGTNFAVGDNLQHIKLVAENAAFYPIATVSASGTLALEGTPVKEMVHQPENNFVFTSGDNTYTGWLMVATKAETALGALRMVITTNKGSVLVDLGTPAGGYFAPGKPYAMARTIDVANSANVLWFENMGPTAFISNTDWDKYDDWYSTSGVVYDGSANLTVRSTSAQITNDRLLFFGTTPPNYFIAKQIALKGVNQVGVSFKSARSANVAVATYNSEFTVWYSFATNPGDGDWTQLTYTTDGRTASNSSTWLTSVCGSINTTGQSTIAIKWQCSAASVYRLDDMSLTARSTYVPPSISVAPPTMTIMSAGTAQNATITATAGVVWTATSDQAWCLLDGAASSGGTGSGTLAVSCTNYTGATDRTATVTISAIGLPSQEIGITQLAPGSKTEQLVATVDFETGFTTSTIYNNQTAKSDGPTGSKWSILSGSVTTTTGSRITGLNSLQMRYYTNTSTTYGFARTDYDQSDITKVLFKAKNSSNATVKVEYSDDNGTSWKNLQTIILSTTAAEYTYTLNGGNAVANARVKFTLSATTDKADVIIDDIKFYGLRD